MKHNTTVHTDVLYKQRKLRGWTQQQVANLLGVNVATISRIETGKRKTGSTIKRLADALEVDMEEVLE